MHDKEIRIKSCLIDESRDIKIESDHVPIIWEIFKNINEVTNEGSPKAQWNDFVDVDWMAYNTMVEYDTIKVKMENVKDEVLKTCKSLRFSVTPRYEGDGNLSTEKDSVTVWIDDIRFIE